ncbi:DUF2061 domain-containing protein [Litoribaculum gwangyangense]|uniref:DUF2061 domain-containing protein n=1 Tax=Litoribaculum gwangyangense TaxID=1130722 RepID=A0ABP9BVV9_9FLAO
MIIDSVLSRNTKEEKVVEVNSGTADNSTEKVKRSLAKTISWRIVGTLDTVLISWLITGTLSLAFSIGLVELVTKMVLYFFHERAWNNIKWGR